MKNINKLIDCLHGGINYQSEAVSQQDTRSMTGNKGQSLSCKRKNIFLVLQIPSQCCDKPNKKELFDQKPMCMLSQGHHAKKPKKLEGSTIFSKFKVVTKIANGSFGEVYLAENGTQQYAVKAEPIGTKQPQVLLEGQIYKYLHGEGKITGIPNVYATGIEAKHNLLVMDLLGPSLSQLMEKNGPFSVQIVMGIGIQLFNRLEALHSRGFVHRDIKPQNILIGLGQQKSRLFLVDLGLSNKYLTRDKTHISERKDKELTGTARYASINSHLGYEQSRRDDIESIAYVLIYLLHGSLPWQGLKATSAKSQFEAIMKKKMEIDLSLPHSLIQLLRYCRALQFEEKPDYDLLRGLLDGQNGEKKNNLDSLFTDFI